jgi:hypothetical protein
MRQYESISGAWVVFATSSPMEQSFIASFDDENEARKEYEAYVGSDTTCMLTNNGKLIAVHGSKGVVKCS